MTIKEFFLGQNVYANGAPVEPLTPRSATTITPSATTPETITTCAGESLFDDTTKSCIPCKTGEKAYKEEKICCPNGLATNADGSIKSPAQCLVNKAGTLGIKCSPSELMNNTCSWNINKTLGTRPSDPNPNPTVFVQDIVLGATSFVGTLIMIALVYLGIKAVMAGASDSDEMGNIKSKAKSLVIGLLLIISSYTIIRIVQYVARGY